MNRAIHGDWLVSRGEDRGTDSLRAVHLVELRSVDATGSVAEELWRRSVDPTASATDPSSALRLAGRLQPALAELVVAQARYPAQPATRAALLRGTGYQLLFIELTDQCNERCVHCYASASPEGSEHLPLDYLQSAIRDAVALRFGLIQLTGGDPLVSSHVVPAARLVRELGGPPVEVYTNGLRLHGALFEDLHALGTRFAFSLYGHDPVVHDAITRTPGSHARTLRGIRLAAESGATVRVSVIVTDGVSPELEPTYELLEAQGVPRAKVAAAGSVAVGRGDFLPLARLTSAPAPTHGAPAEGTRGRGFGGKVAIAPDGRVMPCIFDRDVTLGHLASQTLREILEDERPLDRGIDAAGSAHRHAQRLSCRECQVRTALLRAP